MGSGFSKMKKQARLMQEQMADVEKKLKDTEVIGSAGNGLVSITLSGEKEIKKIKIRPECVTPNDIEGLQDLIIAAFRDAVHKIDKDTPSFPSSLLGKF